MLFRFYIALAICVLVSHTPFVASAKTVDRVIAVVNNDIITLSELDEEMAGVATQITATTPPENVARELANAREKVLNSLIDKKLIAQKAKVAGVIVTEQDVDNAFAAVLQRTGMNREAMIRTLEKDGLTEATYRDTLKSQLLQNALISRELRQKIVVTEEAVRNYYDEHYTSEVDQGEYYLLQIGVNWPPSSANPTTDNATQEKTRKHVQQIHDLARSGQDFRQLAKKFSDLPSAVDGGDIGGFALEDMADDMREAVADLNAGEVSKIIETSSGYQFFKLLSAGEGIEVSTASYQKVREEIRQILFEKQMKEMYRDWLVELKNNAYIQKR